MTNPTNLTMEDYRPYSQNPCLMINNWQACERKQFRVLLEARGNFENNSP